MVEAAGIEPASEEVRTEASTRLAVSFFYLTADPLSGKWVVGQPLVLDRPLGASRPVQPGFASPGRIASGGAIRQTSQLKLRELAQCCQLFVSTLLTRGWYLGVLLQPLPIRRIQFAPGFLQYP